MRTDYKLLLGGALAALSSCAGGEADAPKRPNILFILSDDHTREGISAYGGRFAEIAPTPNIDAIAENGVLMENVICTNSISGPSRACLLTGKYSTEHGFYQNEGGIIFDSTQLQYQHLLKEAGYKTALIGKWHLYSMPTGFDHFMIHNDKSQQGLYWNSTYNINGVDTVANGYSTTITANAALEWLDKNAVGDEPFAMMLHFKAPHRPWEPDSCYQNLFDGVEMPYPETFNDDYKTRETTLGVNMATVENHLSRLDLKQTPPEGLSGMERLEWLWYGGNGNGEYWTPDENLTGEELKKWKYQGYVKDYLSCVRSVDDQVGRVIQMLKDKGVYENTLIIYMGDQGFYMGEHGIYDKRWMYEESLIMPCVISYPNDVKAGQKLSEIALNVDIAPTILDFAGIEVPSEMQGESMKALLEGDKTAAENWRTAAYYQYFEYPKWHNVQPHFGIRTDRYKLIHYYYNIDTWEFFDMQKDPNELSNQYSNPEYSEIIEGLKVELKELQVKYNDDVSFEARRELTDRYMLMYDGGVPEGAKAELK
ncbi:MAG: sulfatase [Rikenellaceae bacterium]